MFNKKYNPKKPLIYIHVPKCGGTSIMNQFKIWFGQNMQLNYYDERNGSLPKVYDLKYPFLRVWKPNKCIYGHFNSNRGFGISEMYPEIDQFISVIRHPVEMIISNYFYLGKVGDEFKDKSRLPLGADIYKYVSTCKMNFLNHFPTRLTEEDFKDKILEQFIYIGIMEDYATSMETIASKLNKANPEDVFYTNRTERNLSFDRDRVNSILNERFPLELKVYDFVKSIYN